MCCARAEPTTGSEVTLCCYSSGLQPILPAPTLKRGPWAFCLKYLSWIDVSVPRLRAQPWKTVFPLQYSARDSMLPNTVGQRVSLAQLKKDINLKADNWALQKTHTNQTEPKTTTTSSVAYALTRIFQCPHRSTASQHPGGVKSRLTCSHGCVIHETHHKSGQRWKREEAPASTAHVLWCLWRLRRECWIPWNCSYRGL